MNLQNNNCAAVSAIMTKAHEEVLQCLSIICSKLAINEFASTGPRYITVFTLPPLLLCHQLLIMKFIMVLWQSGAAQPCPSSSAQAWCRQQPWTACRSHRPGRSCVQLCHSGKQTVNASIIYWPLKTFSCSAVLYSCPHGVAIHITFKTIFWVNMSRSSLIIIRLLLFFFFRIFCKIVCAV